jgi:predicted ATPase
LTDRIAFVIAGLVGLAALADYALNNGEAMLFLARRMIDLISYLSFWR